MGLFQGDPKMQQVFPFPEGKFHFLVKGRCVNVLIIIIYYYYYQSVIFFNRDVGEQKAWRPVQKSKIVFFLFSHTVLDDEQEETLRAYVDPVSKFFEVGLCFQIIVAFFYYNVELHFQKGKFYLSSPKSPGGGDMQFCVNHGN